MDVRDAFLQVPQSDPIEVKIQGTTYVVKRNLPGQRKGAKQWYDFLRSYLESEMDLRSYLKSEMQYTFCVEQPCLAHNGDSTLLIHVDDILFCGSESNWESFLAGMKQVFSELLKAGRSRKQRMFLATKDDGDGWLVNVDTWHNSG